MHIWTGEGWVELKPRVIVPAGHTPSMLEREGITPEYDGVAEMARYANAPGRGVFFTYHRNGTVTQTKGAEHPLHGVLSVAEMGEG
jgi:hypothetical protein